MATEEGKDEVSTSGDKPGKDAKEEPEVGTLKKGDYMIHVYI